MPETLRPQEVFSQRAAFYTTSQTHSDAAQLESLVALAAPQPDWTVLDVGTGTGHTALTMAPHAASVVGIDLTIEMLAQARLLEQAQGLRLSWALADAEALPFATASFDLVTCRRSAHHFHDLGRALAEMARVVEPGGVVLIDDRSIPEDEAIDTLMNQLDVWHDHSHVREYRASEWVAMLSEAGLAVTHVEGYAQHRSFTSFAHGAGDEDLAGMRARLAAATPHERALLALEERDGELYFNNWYVVLRAVKHER
ncbi:MAG: class I SAM-dependent methyltransferase [Anaerolineales bacterium]